MRNLAWTDCGVLFDVQTRNDGILAKCLVARLGIHFALILGREHTRAARRATQVLSPFVYHATQKVLADSFADLSKPLPTRMREKPGLYQASHNVTCVKLPFFHAAAAAAAPRSVVATQLVRDASLFPCRKGSCHLVRLSMQPQMCAMASQCRSAVPPLPADCSMTVS